MKTCEYCGTKAEDNILQCKNCGSNDFENICINCGKTFTGSKCPGCGVLVGENPRICNNCGKKTFEKVCPGCGTDLTYEKSDKIVYTYINTEINTNSKINANIKFYTNDEIHPDTVTNTDSESNIDINTINYEEVHKAKKKFGRIYKIFVVLVIIIVIIGIKGNDNDNENKSDNKKENASEDISEDKSTDKNTLSDLEILTLDSHPKFYGDYKEAKKFWADYKQVMVDKTSSEYEDKLLLAATGNNKVITDITIDFTHSDEIKHKLTVEKVLKIVCEYIPYDILEKYYEYTESFYETSKDGNYKAYHYIMSLNKEGKAASANNDFLLYDKFAFKIIHKNDDDWIVKINRSAYKGKHEKSDKYEVEYWKADLNKYK